MDALFNLFKVRFAKLDELMEKNCKVIDKDHTVNVFINLEPVIKKLIGSNIQDYLKVRNDEKIFEMISNILNLAAHYRLFFSKNKLYSNVYLYMGHPFKSDYKNTVFNEDYRKYYTDRFTIDPKTTVLSTTMNTALPFLRIITQYIKGVHFITSNSVEPSMIPRIITNETEGKVINFIISNDKYDYQYVKDDFYIIRPKKEHSYIVSKDNLISRLKLDEKVDTPIDVDISLYPFILSLLGDKYRGIDKIKRMGLASILKVLDKGVSEGVIGSNASNINLLLNVIKEEYQKMILNNFYCIDIETQFSMLNIKNIHGITDQIIDKYNNEALKDLNEKYFLYNPILLMELTSANNLIKRKTKDIFLNKGGE